MSMISENTNYKSNRIYIFHVLKLNCQMNVIIYCTRMLLYVFLFYFKIEIIPINCLSI